MPATSHPHDGTVAEPYDGAVAEPSRSIPAYLSGADEVSCTVTPLHDDDIVLVRLDSGRLSIELPLPSDAALDLSLRLCASVIRLRRSNPTGLS